MLDLMKENVARPARLIDITRLPLKAIEPTPDGGLRLGALATNADTAWHDEVARRYPLVSKAILAGRRRRSATWRRTAAISFSARAAGTSTTPLRLQQARARARAAARATA